jgi:hypothetical protein
VGKLGETSEPRRGDTNLLKRKPGLHYAVINNVAFPLDTAYGCRYICLRW